MTVIVKGVNKLKLYATEYKHQRYDSGIKENLVTIEVQADRFIDIMSKNKGKRGFKGVYAL